MNMLDQFTATCKQITKGIAKGYKCRKQMKDWVFLYDGENEMTVRYFYKKTQKIELVVTLLTQLKNVGERDFSSSLK